MSEKLTRISLPGRRVGLLEWGEVSPEEMIRKLRSYGEGLRAEAEKIAAASDLEFKVEIVRGSHVQRHVKTLQEPAS